MKTKHKWQLVDLQISLPAIYTVRGKSLSPLNIFFPFRPCCENLCLHSWIKNIFFKKLHWFNRILRKNQDRTKLFTSVEERTNYGMKKTLSENSPVYNILLATEYLLYVHVSYINNKTIQYQQFSHEANTLFMIKHSSILWT